MPLTIIIGPLFWLSLRFAGVDGFVSRHPSRWSHHVVLQLGSPTGEEEEDNFFKDTLDDSKLSLGDDDIDDELPPLPPFLETILEDDGTTAQPPRQETSSPAALDNSSSGGSTSTNRVLIDETQRRIEQQQKQIDQLLKAIEEKAARKREEPAPTQSVTPLKTMLFIDGTWLYYSIFERQACAIVERFGHGWPQRYEVNWSELPRIICEEIQKQEQAWYGGVARPVEIARANVFTSLKKSTPTHSERLQMFNDMRASGYDVFMMETTGPGEKCIDIQLAVEMLHYATVPNAYDVAFLVSGDKDFLPALIRTRQKARKVGILSMKSACTRALIDTPSIKDYDMLWIEDYLDRLIVPKQGVIDNRQAVEVSKFTFMKIIYDFIDKSDMPLVSSRDVGRYLKRLQIGGSDLGNEIKRLYRGLFYFCINTKDSPFRVERDNFRKEERRLQANKNDLGFFVGLTGDAEQILLNEAKSTHFSDAEKEFFDTYSLDILDNAEISYPNSVIGNGGSVSSVNGEANHFVETPSAPDYAVLKVVQLKNVCRERGLTVSGTKAALVERLQEDDKRNQVPQPIMQGVAAGLSAEEQSHAVQQAVATLYESPSSPHPQSSGSDKVAEYLLGLMTEYLRTCGGTSGSRNLGRYLSAHKSHDNRDDLTALTEMKKLFGSMGKFVNLFPSHLVVKPGQSSSSYEFDVGLLMMQTQR